MFYGPTVVVITLTLIQQNGSAKLQSFCRQTATQLRPTLIDVHKKEETAGPKRTVDGKDALIKCKSSTAVSMAEMVLLVSFSL